MPGAQARERPRPLLADARLASIQLSQTGLRQVQHVSHKRTFLYLEQMIIRHQAHRKISGFAPSKMGLDFEFARPQEAARFVDFVRTIVPVKTSVSKKLVGENRSSNVTNYRFNIPNCISNSPF